MKRLRILRRNPVVATLPALILILLVMVCSSLLPIQPVAVATNSVAKPKGLTLSPLRTEVGIAPGTVYDGSIKVTNNTSSSMGVSVSASAFSVINEQYDYAFTAESDLAKWVAFTPNETLLAPGKSQDIAFRISAPLSAEPGGRYISLFVATDVRSPDSAVDSMQRIASLLYINVLGDVSRTGHLVSLNSPWFTTGGAVWSAVVQDSGTTHYRSRYMADIRDIFGGEVASKTGSNLVLPGTVRLISGSLPLPSLPGVYKIVYTIGLGDTPAVVETRYILYLQPIVIVAILAVTGVGAYKWWQFAQSKKKR